MKALSIRQPWASAILRLGKDIENRDWPTTRRGTIAIHATKPICFEDLQSDLYDCDRRSNGEVSDYGLTHWADEELPGWPKYRAAIIGIADLVDCVTQSNSRWFTGKYGFVLTNSRPLKSPIICPGTLGFWELPSEITQEITKIFPIGRMT